MLDDSRLGDYRRRIDDAADHARGIYVFGNLSAGIDRFKLPSFPLAAVTIEVPPGNTVLHAYYRCFRSNQRSEVWGHRRQTVCLKGQDHDIGDASLRRIIGRRDARIEVSDLAAHANSMLLHRAQMRAARDQGHILTGFSKHGADEGPDGAGADYGKFHNEP